MTELYKRVGCRDYGEEPITVRIKAYPPPKQQIRAANQPFKIPKTRSVKFMMTRAEKLFNIRAQVQKAVSCIDHGDGPGTDMILADALIAMVTLIEEEMPEKVLPALHAEPTRLKVKK